MSYPDAGAEPVRIPADVDREDRLLGDLTARQVAILAVAAASLWLAWLATRTLMPLAAFAGAAAPAALAVVMLALGRRDGLPLDRLAAAALRQARSPRRMVPAPEGVHPPPRWLTRTVTAQALPLPAPLRLPVTAMSTEGPLSLGDDAVAIAAASTVNFALRTPAEQQALTAAFGRWLNSLQCPVQILVRAHRIDLTEVICSLRGHAPSLPHPALEAAALGHAAFLEDLAASRDLLARQVLIAVREPTPAQAARRIAGAARALAAADVAVGALDGPQAASVLASCCDPACSSPSPSTARRGQVITAATPAVSQDWSAP